MRFISPKSRRLLVLVFAISVANTSASSQAQPLELVIGQVASLSGPNGADLGLGLQLGLRLALNKVNARGGINGRRLRLVSKDDVYIPEETVRLTKELIDQDNVIALAGYRGTANTIALMSSNILTDRGVALVGTLTGAQEVQGAANIYHVRTSYQDEIRQIIEQLSSMGITRIGIFHAEDAFGRSGRVAAEKALALQNQRPAAIAAYDNAAGQVLPTIEKAVRTLIAAQPQAVVIVAVGDPVYEFVQRFRKDARSPRLISISVVDPAAVATKVGPEYSRGMGFSQVFPFPYNDTVRIVREYRELLKRYAPDVQPSYFSLEGYIDGLVLIEAIKNAGPNPSRARIIQELNKIAELDLGGFFLRFNSLTHNSSKFTELTVIGEDGKLKR